MIEPPEGVHTIGFCFMASVIEIATAHQLWGIPFPPYNLNILSIVHAAVAVAFLCCGIYMAVDSQIRFQVKRDE